MMSRILVQGFLLAMMCMTPGFSQHSRDNANALHKDLLQDYNQDVRPNDNQLEATNVNLSLSLNVIVETDEQKGTFSLSAGLHLSWLDPRFRWNPSSYGGLQTIQVTSTKVWVPHIMFITPMEKNSVFTNDKDKVVYTHKGEAYCHSSNLITVNCGYNMLNYPFDSHTCEMVAMPLSYGWPDIRFGKNLTPLLDKFVEHEEWILEKASMENLEKEPVVSSVKILIKIRRRWEFFLLTNVTPVFCLLLLNSMVFVLPPQSGERVGYSITCLLALTVFLTVITDDLPVSSKNMCRMSSYIITMLCMSTSICVCTILTLKVYNLDSSQPLPFWLNKLSRILACKSKTRSNKISVINRSVNSKPNDKDITTRNTQEMISESRLNLVDLETELDWKNLGVVLDRYLFYGSLCTSIIITFTFFALISTEAPSII